MWRVFVIAALAAAICTPADATLITYSWTGTVTSSHAGPLDLPAGATIDISLTLDNSFPDQNPSPNVGFYQCFLCSPPQLVGSVNFGSISGFLAGSIQTAEVLNNEMGIDEVLISTGGPHTACCFTILFQTSNLDVLASDALPLFIDPTEFQTATFSVQPCLSLACSVFNGFSGTIDAAGAVPEPSALTLFGLGLLVALMLRRHPIRLSVTKRGATRARAQRSRTAI